MKHNKKENIKWHFLIIVSVHPLFLTWLQLLFFCTWNWHKREMGERLNILLVWNLIQARKCVQFLSYFNTSNKRNRYSLLILNRERFQQKLRNDFFHIAGFVEPIIEVHIEGLHHSAHIDKYLKYCHGNIGWVKTCLVYSLPCILAKRLELHSCCFRC